MFDIEPQARRTTFTAGTTPVNLIRERLDVEPFTWNLQGIDSDTLEAAMDGKPERHLPGGSLTTQQALNVLAGLWEFTSGCGERDEQERQDGERYTREELRENAWSLRSGILECLDIEEV